MKAVATAQRKIGARRRRGLTLVLSSVPVLLLACVDQQRAVGEGHLQDAGCLAFYPRYEVTVEPIPLSGEQTRHYKFRDLPTAAYSLRLAVLESGRDLSNPDNWHGVWERLDRSEVTVRVMLIEDAAAEARWEFAGPLTSAWLPAAWGSQRYFRSDELDSVKLGDKATLTLEISVEGSDSLGAAVLLQPSLVGGGFEV